jgi:response regulator RpfG family c-di-GMP phosphodiesterase
MLEISKMQKEEITDISIVELGLVSKQTFEDIKEKLLAKEKWSGVIECKHDRKKSCYIDAVFSPILQNNSVVEFICISHDVTPIYDLYTEIENTQKEVVFTMGAIGESRSKETGYHVKRVAEYSLVLAQLAGLKEDKCELLRQASPMHDIGKVGIPDSILHKPGKLDENEWKIMKTHAKLGYNMLKHSQRDILKTAAIVAHEHHEKWNGKGYPKGLAGEKIHIYGRITAIADVFDALGSDRCYKKAWKLDKIIELFQEERGQSFDPNLVNLFLGNIEKFLEIRSKYMDVIEDDSE